MDFWKRHLKRIATDTAGYLLLLAALLTGWLPGPGGIPLAIAGLGLLSIHNAWARTIRDYLLENGGRFVHKAFPAHPFVQWAYDALVVGLLGVAILLAIRHAALWQLSLAVTLFCIALVIGFLNRDRFNRLKNSRRD